MVAHPPIRMMRQKDYCKFKASLNYIVTQTNKPKTKTMSLTHCALQGRGCLIKYCAWHMGHMSQGILFKWPDSAPSFPHSFPNSHVHTSQGNRPWQCYKISIWRASESTVSFDGSDSSGIPQSPLETASTSWAPRAPLCLPFPALSAVFKQDLNTSNVASVELSPPGLALHCFQIQIHSRQHSLYFLEKNTQTIYSTNLYN